MRRYRLICRTSPSKRPAGSWGTNGEEALFPPAAVVRSQVFRALSPDRSIRNTVSHLVAEGMVEPISQSAWDQARARLPEEILAELVRLVAEETAAAVPSRWRGREVVLVDGTTVSMPDEPELVDAFGYCDSKHGPSKFPTARMLALLHGFTRQVTDFRLAHYRTSELALFRELLPTLPRGAVWVADRYFSSSVEFVLSRRLGADFVTRLHQRRDGDLLARQGRRLGKDDWLVRLKISAPVHRKYEELNLPESVEARLIRVRYKTPWDEKRTVWLVTSLLDAAEFPRREIVALYRSRWGIETHYAYLKTTLQMAVLRSKTPGNIRREVSSILLAHNLVWRLMHEAARLADREANKAATREMATAASGVATAISFTGAARAALAFSPRLRFARSGRERLEIYDELLAHIAGLIVPYRPSRHEPRLRKRDPQSFAVLRTSREEARRCA